MKIFILVLLGLFDLPQGSGMYYHIIDFKFQTYNACSEFRRGMMRIDSNAPPMICLETTYDG